ncbi:TonB-dependent receptor [Undibacterium sp. MH2W]|uniref:TonB-dependent receptor n=1 Tax=Undibacterium sp. MH2W TaxID=3413044 RepID=UPI003BF13508
MFLFFQTLGSDPQSKNNRSNVSNVSNVLTLSTIAKSIQKALMFSGHSRFIFFVPLVACIQTASAADGDNTENIVAFAPQAVVIESRHYNNAVGTSDAASQGVILGELLQDRPLLRPGEVLETIPGMVVTQHSGDGKANQYFLRGYNLDHGTDFATRVDGVPVNMPTNAHGQGYSDLNFLIPELVDHIDYRKGTYFAENGDFAAAGSADIQYRSRLDHAFIDATVGAYNYRRVVVAGSTPLSDDPENSHVPVLLGGLELMEENGPWSPPEHARKVNFFGRLSDGNRDQGWSIESILYDAHWHSVDQVPLSLIQSGEISRYGAVDPTDGGNTGRYIVSGEWHSRNQDGYSTLSAYAEHTRLQLWSNFTLDEYRPATGDQFEQVESRNIVGAKAVRGWRMPLFGHDSITEAGLEIRHDQIRVGLLNSAARIPFETVTDDKVAETTTGMYLQNTTDWTPWFRSLIGARADRTTMDMTSLQLPANSGSASGAKLSPKLSLTFGPWQKTEIFLNAGKGFHSNDARGVIDKIDPTTGTASSPVPVLVGSIGKEIGLRTEIIPGLQSSLALWSLNSESELTYNQDSAIGSTSPNGASKRYGIEWNNRNYVAAAQGFSLKFMAVSATL